DYYCQSADGTYNPVF
nr:immunoglobulin light chain junction region [Macaca mulatta]